MAMNEDDSGSGIACFAGHNEADPVPAPILFHPDDRAQGPKSIKALDEMAGSVLDNRFLQKLLDWMKNLIGSEQRCFLNIILFCNTSETSRIEIWNEL